MTGIPGTPGATGTRMEVFVVVNDTNTIQSLTICYMVSRNPYLQLGNWGY